MQLGTVKYFNAVKGYGFILRDDGRQDVFVHAKDIRASGYTSLDAGNRVQFHTKPARESDRSAVACKIQVFDASGNLKVGDLTPARDQSDSEELMRTVFRR